MTIRTVRKTSSPASITLAVVHGLYNMGGGLWPLVDMDSFELVTGAKCDEWLVRTVAGIVLFIGLLLLHDALNRRRIDRTLKMMAGGIAGVLGIVALAGSLSGIIAWVYVIDGSIHCGFMLAWTVLHLSAMRTSIS